ncbi:flagellar hook-associated protein FlgK [Shewanella sp. Choline-02u-19]|uniref:flagellar hook-associated protein FlgK n=1 Tax=unclassified Shewanella TaxID=196818 RepID=UPI000C34A926|nr:MULTISPECIES: flagellar hook-associated protein FlgK [unclassified Shewanella]PKH55727.1 flagellar hook-associated protein FlgK [Shewanella sp. Bg11-22]PKI26859.1 flagellar hook-associated protein FlgK [Shewanella sp. Choline-02u-19]
MSMDLLSIARTGVLASQSQLAITSNNIANANTDGYNRQVVSQSSLESQRMGSEFYGAGTYVSDVKRVYNDYAARELRIGQTAVSEAQTTYSKMSELDQLFSQIGSAVPASLNSFFAGINSLADIPDDLGLRDSLLTNANQLANNVNQMQQHLDGQMSQSNDQISAVTDRINEISNELGNLNRELMKSQGQDMQLLDKQDALILELSEYAEVNVVPLESGAKSVMLGGSIMLVSGEVSMQIGTKPGDPHGQELQITASAGGKSLVVDASKVGGQLGALVDFRDDTLIPAQLELGQFALGVADAFNQAQSQGFDLNGQVGANIFTDINDPSMQLGRVGALSTNTGNANLSVNIDDVGSLTGSSYELSLSATSQYELKDSNTGKVTTLTVNGNTLEGADGFSIDIASGVMSPGDKFEIRPTSSAATALSVTMTDGKGIAAAGTSPAADGDNSNLINMAKLNETKMMNGGSTTLTDVFENTKLDIGGKTKSAEISVGSAGAIYNQAYSRVQSVSGVNLDEEAANLMRFQQSYQASARIMTTATEIFNTLFSSLR